MYRKNGFVSMLVLAALLLSACQPVRPQATPSAPEPVGLRPDAPEYAKHGPFWVGFKPLVMGEGTDHPIEASLWYPALNPKGLEEAVTYPIKLKIPTDPLDAPPVIYGHALQGAPVDDSQAPYPLVIFSHGFSTNAAWTPTILEHLASYGFVVLAPEHVEQFDWEASGAPSASIDRPRDIKQTLDYAEQMNAPGGEMAGLIDVQNVAVAGQSLGGYTTLAMAGAQYDLDAFNARCAELPPDDPNTFLCAPLVTHEAEMAARAGLDPMPEGLWPSFGDPRVKAIVPMASDSYLFDKAGLAKITVPMMAIGGDADTGTPYDWGVRPAYDNASSAHKTLVTFHGAEHTFFNPPCEDMPWIDKTPFYEWICFDPVWDRERSLDLIHHFTTAFLLAELKGDADAAAALAPENVAFPGIQYETTAYGAAPSTETRLDAETVAKIEALVQKTMDEGPVPGVAVGVVIDGALVYAKGFGVAELGGDKPVTPESVFFMASIAKSFVATAIMQLVDEGKIDLDAPVTDYLPYFTMADPKAAEITIRQLLSHSAGMPDIAEWNYTDVRTDAGALEDIVRSNSGQALLYPPGKDWAYSNLGFMVLGDVVAKVSGQSFEDYVQEHILMPLGMKSSTFLLSEVDPAALVSPHMYQENGDLEVSGMPYNRAYAPAAALFANLDDMARFVIANMNHGELAGVHVLPASAYDQMWTAQAASHWVEMFGQPVANYGLGWWAGDLDGRRIIGNYGAEDGYQTHLGIFPDEGFAVIVLANVMDFEEGSFHAYNIGNGIAEVLFGQ